jgi:competence protein ComEA
MKKPPLLLVSFGVLVVFLVWYWQRRQNKLPYLEASIPATPATRALSDEEPLTFEPAKRSKQAVKMPEILPSERDTPRPMPQPAAEPSAVPMPSVDPSSDSGTKLVAFAERAEAELASDDQVDKGEQLELAQQADSGEVKQEIHKQEAEAELASDDQAAKGEQLELAQQADSGEVKQEIQKQEEEAEAKAEAERLAAQANPTKPEKRLNPNTASLQELIDLPGIGPVLAKRIIDYRDAHGTFKTIDDLVVIQGIGPNNIRQFDFLLAIDQDESAS